MKKCVVIGSGLGGLSTGVILAKNGYEVTILEQAHQIGGCLQCFEREGVKYETGMHFIGSMDDGQVLSNYLNYLEIKDKIKLSRLNPEAYDVISLDGERFAIPNGREAFIEKLSARFPSQRENLKRYCDLVHQVASLSPYRDLEGSSEASTDNSLLFRSIDNVLEQTVTDPLLRKVLLCNISLYAAVRGITPFSTHAFIFDFYNNGAFRIVGGSDTIAQALTAVLNSHGGRVLTRQKVTKIAVEDKVAKGVMTENGEFYPADLVISDINPKHLLDMVDDKVFNRAYQSRIQEMRDTASVFSLYLRFKDESMPYYNSNFYGFRVDTPWDVTGKVDGTWPQGYLYMHYCHEDNPRFAQSAVILSYMSMDAVKQWECTTVGHRGSDYEQFKKDMAERLISLVEKDFPGLRDSIADINTATPLTYRDYTLTPNGSMYGLAKNVQMGVAGSILPKTKVPNLLLAGQSVNAHGMLGVLVGSMKVCAQLIGEQELRRQVIAANSKSLSCKNIEK